MFHDITTKRSKDMPLDWFDHHMWFEKKSALLLSLGCVRNAMDRRVSIMNKAAIKVFPIVLIGYCTPKICLVLYLKIINTF